MGCSSNESPPVWLAQVLTSVATIAVSAFWRRFSFRSSHLEAKDKFQTPGTW